MKVCSVCQRCFEDSALSCSEVNHPLLSAGRAGNCQIIANYRLEFLLESSGMVETYRAVNTILKKTYLIKILAPDLFDERSGKQFLSETRELSAIIHPNVARVFESGVLVDGFFYVVTEFFTAQTLRECLTNVGTISEVSALTIARQAAEGLEAIHAVGVLHRNISPENMILTTDAENRFLVKLQNIDFGGIRSKPANSNAEQNLNDLRYFAPEQCTAQEVDAQTDVYSLGVVLYEALAGCPPFDASDACALINKQINEPPPPVEIHNFDIRMLLQHTLTDALQKTQRLRLKTANAFARRMRHIEQIATHSPTPPPAIAYPAAMNKAAVRFAPPPKIGNPSAVENKPAAEIVENFASPAKVFPDLTTTKLPPIEAIIGNGLSENVTPHQSAPIFYEMAESPAIHVTNEAVLIEWKQPDDIPPDTETLKTKKKETVDTKPFLIEDDDSIFDEDEIDSPFDDISETDEFRSRYAAARSAFSYADSGRSWNFPDKRKMLKGAGFAALFVLAVGGTLLSRQFQLASDARQTTTQSSPGGRSLPKSAEPDKVSETDKSSNAKPEKLSVNNPSSSVDYSEMPNLPDYQPRDVEEKIVVAVSQKSNNKRVFKKNSERRDAPTQNKTVSNESFDKKGEIRSSSDKSPALKSQVSTSTKPDIFTRPRIVKKEN